ncbi:MAG: radical SAM/SPASM domain-containing protein [Thermoplasmata archaeon]|jgi:MoaA/NifB/PqqE/SkfB family radical SAM enzyme|nr:radical SAM protein [Thermoplasmatales archaeon]PMP75560.1 MAG: radical SAM protein [Aciduliprofundum sp.]HEU12814.1 radical SAM/SPASM domain-containing protein [Euryarchaeota archaeon]
MNRNLRAFKWFMETFLNNGYEKPVYGSYKLLHECNLRCEFCNVWRTPMKALDTKGAMKVIDRLADSTITVLSLEGGEPLLRKDLLEIIKHAHERSFYLFFTTNGILLPKAPLKEFSKYLDFIHISIDEGHGNLFLLDDLKKYVDMGLRITVQTVVTKNDIDSLREKVEKVHNAGARILIMPAVHFDDVPDLSPDRKLMHDKLLELKREFGGTVVTSRAFIDALENHYTCHSYGLSIESNGDVIYPCSVIGRKIGNLIENDLETILSSEEAERGRQMMYSCKRECFLYLHAETSNFLKPKNLANFLMDTVEGYFLK